MAAVMTDLPTFRAQNSSPPPVNPPAAGTAAAATPYLAPVASAVADAAGRSNAAVNGLFAPMRGYIAQGAQDVQQGDYTKALGAGLGAAGAGTLATLATAGDVAASPFVAAANVGRNVLSGLMAGPGAAPIPAHPDPAVTTAMVQAAGQKAAASLVPAMTYGGNPDKAVAADMSRNGVAAQGMAPGSVGVGTSPDPSATHTFFGGLPAFMVPQMAETIAKGRTVNANPIADLVDNLRKSSAASASKTDEQLAKNEITLKQAEDQRAQQQQIQDNKLQTYAGLAKMGIVSGQQ